MKNFTYVMYEGSICVLIEHNNKKATIDGFSLYNCSDSVLIYEIDVDLQKISPCMIEISKKSMIYRFRDYRMVHGDIFGFIDQELSLIHQFQ